LKALNRYDTFTTQVYRNSVSTEAYIISWLHKVYASWVLEAHQGQREPQGL